MTDHEMTRALAERVMGWEPEPGGSPAWCWYKDWAADRKTYRPRSIAIAGGGWKSLNKIADAWEVRDKLAEHASVMVVNRQYLKTRVDIAPWEEGRGIDGAMVEDPSAPRAICICALRAVGVEA